MEDDIGCMSLNKEQEKMYVDKEGSGDYFYEDDPDYEYEGGADAAILNTKFRWPGGKIPYEFDKKFTLGRQAELKSLLTAFNKKTGGCVHFK